MSIKVLNRGFVMHKQSFISFASLLIFWIVISVAVDLQHIIVGIFLSIFTVWFWQDLNPRLPSIMSPRELLLFCRCIVMLVGYVIKSSIDVTKILLFSNLSVSPVFLQMKPGVKSDWGRVFLATCITITPGTVTIDVDPETNIFTVHALTREIGEGLLYWRIITEIKKLETLVQRRKANVVDTGRIHGSNSISAIEGDHRTHRN